MKKKGRKKKVLRVWGGFGRFVKLLSLDDLLYVVYDSWRCETRGCGAVWRLRVVKVSGGLSWTVLPNIVVNVDGCSVKMPCCPCCLGTRIKFVRSKC